MCACSVSLELERKRRDKLTGRKEVALVISSFTPTYRVIFEHTFTHIVIPRMEDNVSEMKRKKSVANREKPKKKQSTTDDDEEMMPLKKRRIRRNNNKKNKTISKNSPGNSNNCLDTSSPSTPCTPSSSCSLSSSCSVFVKNETGSLSSKFSHFILS